MSRNGVVVNLGISVMSEKEGQECCNLSGASASATGEDTGAVTGTELMGAGTETETAMGSSSVEQSPVEKGTADEPVSIGQSGVETEAPSLHTIPSHVARPTAPATEARERAGRAMVTRHVVD